MAAVEVLPAGWEAPRYWKNRDEEGEEEDEDSASLSSSIECIPESDDDYQESGSPRVVEDEDASRRLLWDLASERWWAARPPFLRSRGEYERAEAAYPLPANRVRSCNLPRTPCAEMGMPQGMRHWLRLAAAPACADYLLSLTVLRDKARAGEFAPLDASREGWFCEFDRAASATWRTDDDEDEEEEGGGEAGPRLGLGRKRKAPQAAAFDRDDGDAMMWMAVAARRSAAWRLARSGWPRYLLLWAVQVLPDGPASRVEALCEAVIVYTDLMQKSQ